MAARVSGDFVRLGVTGIAVLAALDLAPRPALADPVQICSSATASPMAAPLLS